jgi:hypothetical protein
MLLTPHYRTSRHASGAPFTLVILISVGFIHNFFGDDFLGMLLARPNDAEAFGGLPQ